MLARGCGRHLCSVRVQPISNEDERVEGMFTKDIEIVEKSFMLISVGGNKGQGGLDSWAVVSENDSDTGFPASR